MSIRTVTPKSVQERTNSNNNRTSLKDSLLDLKVGKGETKEVTIRLVGFPIDFVEYNNLQELPDPNKDGKTTPTAVPFPDAELNKSLTRVGLKNKDECPWYALGYRPNPQYAQNCLLRLPDGTSVPKILKKGSSIFKEITKAELANHRENVKEKYDDSDKLITFMGGRYAHEIEIIAKYNDKKIGKVEYEVNIKNKKTRLTDEEIEMFRKINEPKPEELEEKRSEYLAEKAEDAKLRKDAEYNLADTPFPDWEDFYTYGYPLSRIYKFAPIRTTEESTKSHEMTITANADEDEDSESTVAPVASKPAKAKAKTATVAEESNPFSEESSEEDEVWG